MAQCLFERFISNKPSEIRSKSYLKIEKKVKNSNDILTVKNAFESNRDPLEKYELIYNNVYNLPNKLSFKLNILGENYSFVF